MITGEIRRSVHGRSATLYRQKQAGGSFWWTKRVEAYLDEGYDTYYFRITEEQFDELTKDYWETSKLASKMVKNVIYS